MPNIRLIVSTSLNIKTLTATATTGSNAPRIAVGVEPIYFMANTSAKLEIKVVTKAKTTKLINILTLGKSKESPKNLAFTKKYRDVNKNEKKVSLNPDNFILVWLTIKIYNA